MISIPDRFLVNGRETDNVFAPDEHLFFRFNPTHFSDDMRLPVAAIRFPDFSVNREKFSQPSDVLVPKWIDWGIAQVKVESVPKALECEANKKMRTIFFRVEHDPIDKNHRAYEKQMFENYAHSEIRAFENGKHLEKKLPESIKKRFRMMLSDATKIDVILNPAPE